MIKEIRALVQHILLEDAIDVVETEARIRVRSSRRTITDVLTDIRGIENVITVSQKSAVQDAEDGKQRIIVLIKFEADKNMSLDGLEAKIKEIPEVDMITITSYAGETIRRIS